jgi:hypothetical protein
MHELSSPARGIPTLRLRALRLRTLRLRAPRTHVLAVGAILLGTLGGCESRDSLSLEAGGPESPQDAWWANLSAACGSAFPGALGYAPPGDAMLEGPELLVVHFDVCEADEIRLPFHIEKLDGTWDRSRTWIFRRGDGAGPSADPSADPSAELGTDPSSDVASAMTFPRLEIRHDHRKPDGSEDETTWYGAWTIAEGDATEQRFVIEDRTWPDGLPRGWRVIIEPGVRYTYGTFRGDEWSWRVDFDLSTPLATLPPPAWGYEGGGGPPR